MKRAGFTMIELIFVIVILGILAAVAVPKLSATRSDAEIAKIATNAATVVSDYGSSWTARANLIGTTAWEDVTNTPLQTTGSSTLADLSTVTLSSSLYLTDGTNNCVTFAPVADGNASVAGTLYPSLNVTLSAAGTSAVCDGVRTRILSLEKQHNFGGTGIQ
ncbi:type II secretion system protein [Sulfurimonas sp.]|uniref:type II secretion system protein n=1 Tax=Sulfurimonas sp. TaxID=2022749 RepID=UPI0035629308